MFETFLDFLFENWNPKISAKGKLKDGGSDVPSPAIQLRISVVLLHTDEKERLFLEVVNIYLYI